MRALLVASFVLLGACGKKADAPPPSRAAPGDAAVAKVPPPGAADAAVAPPPKYTKQQRAEYRKHLAAGRKLGGAKKWGEAVTELEAALAVIPMDPAALAEIGLAAYAAGDYKKARKANLDAIRVAGEPKVKAASFYNLGLIAMAEHDEQAAAEAFRASLALRPGNATVQKALAKLGHAVPAPGAVAQEVTCNAPGTLDAICACLVKEATTDDAAADEPPTCGPLEATTEDDPIDLRAQLTNDLRVLAVHGPEHEDAAFLVARSAKTWTLVAPLGTAYNPGAFGISESLSIDKIDQRKLGTHTLLWIETSHGHIDNDAGINESESTNTHDLLVCPFAGKYQCTLAVTLDYSYDRSILIEDEEANAGITHTPGLPRTEQRTLAVALASDGTATVTLVKGTAPDAPGLLGPHPLW